MLRIILLALFALACLDAHSQGEMNDTGSWECRNAQNNGATACAGTQQDGDKGRDADILRNGADDGYGGFSFMKICGSGEQEGTGKCPVGPAVGAAAKQWRCTRDRVTGLAWEVKLKDAKGGDFKKGRRFTRLNPEDPGYGAAGDAANLVAQANAAGLCGRQTWRLPTARELQSIVHYGIKSPGPVVDTTYLPTVMGVGYWTSDQLAGSTTQAWIVDFSNGVVGPIERTYLAGVMLVSEPQDYSSSPLEISADGTEVIDRGARLIWRRCSEGQSWNGITCTGNPRSFGRVGLLSYAASLQDGWRVPNAKELRTLVDLGRAYPAFDPELFPATTTEGPYWSSTPLTGSLPYLWYVASGNGATHFDFHTGGSIRLVRDFP